MKKPYPEYAHDGLMPHMTNPRPEQGLRLVGTVLYFEGVAVANLERIPGGYSSWQGRFIDFIESIEGHPDPGGEIARLRQQIEKGG